MGEIRGAAGLFMQNARGYKIRENVWKKLKHIEWCNNFSGKPCSRGFLFYISFLFSCLCLVLWSLLYKALIPSDRLFMKSCGVAMSRPMKCISDIRAERFRIQAFQVHGH